MTEKTARKLAISTLILSISYMFLLFLIGKMYYGTHQLIGRPVEQIYLFFLTPFLVVLFMVFKNEEMKYRKEVLVAQQVLILIVLLVLLISRPNYTFEEGREIITVSHPELSNQELLEVEELFKTVPVVETRVYFDTWEEDVYNHFYYYVWTGNIKEVYFMLDPYSGRIVKLEDAYWPTPGYKTTWEKLYTPDVFPVKFDENGYYTGFEDIPEGYTFEEALEDGCWYPIFMTNVEVEEKISNFISESEVENFGFIRIIKFRDKGQQGIFFCDLFYYEGKYYFFDSRMENEKTAFEYLKVVKDLQHPKFGEVAVTNMEELTHEHIFKAMISSTLSIDEEAKWKCVTILPDGVK